MNSADGANRFGRRTFGRPSTDELRLRKKAILRAATTQFVKYGFIETSFCDIARDAGVSTRTIYSHYGNKEDVFGEVIELLKREAEDVSFKTELKSSLFETLFDTARCICKYSLSEQAIALNRLMMSSYYLFPQLIENFSTSMNFRLLDSVCQVFEQLAAQSTIPHDDHRETAQFFIDLLLGVSQLQLGMNWIDFTPSEAEIKGKISLFIAGRFGLS